MGNAQPTNKTGRKVVSKKLENAGKTNILSLREHGLDEIPVQVFEIKGMKTLDVSQNKIKNLGSRLAVLTELKSLNVDQNLLVPGSLAPVAKLSKLQIFSAGGNQLGAASSSAPALPALPASLKQIKLDHNSFSSFPPPLLLLPKLEKLDLSHNNLAAVPSEISSLVNLTELNLDFNVVVSLPSSMGQLKKLKTLSLKNNQLRASNTNFSDKNPQPIPASLFEDTPLIDLNLHNNPMTSTTLNEFEGYDKFLARREKIKTKDIYGGALTNLDVCGLK
ncbi:leucine rich repeat [Seminavis robusta]|uniref:Leucine rich repeat n=1 Tax=Seminavis robusta TaxID=568900 RepID=A0A9N8DUK0_9STRA|nr:leucine rich repeat [Seminavis robusta]|eukprot:Sro353_g124600.1 leucine rich repeat (277) ;mRNA; r:54355-55281